MGENPSRFTREGGGGGEHPVENISWSRAVAFCEKLTALTEERTAGRKYRLPTEAEWEYACRAGSKAEFAFGGTLTSTQANFDGNYPYGEMVKGPCAKKTTRVGAYAPNHFGLCDMHGNVWEWCEDTWHSKYRGAPHDGSAWQTGDTPYRVLRGGSWRRMPPGLRSAFRNNAAPDGRNSDLGFRLARGL
jgi:formylglycine-generating enzyme required for sulfatase activity